MKYLSQAALGPLDEAVQWKATWQQNLLSWSAVRWADVCCPRNSCEVLMPSALRQKLQITLKQMERRQ